MILYAHAYPSAHAVASGPRLLPARIGRPIAPSLSSDSRIIEVKEKTDDRAGIVGDSSLLSRRARTVRTARHDPDERRTSRGADRLRAMDTLLTSASINTPTSRRTAAAAFLTPWGLRIASIIPGSIRS